MRTFFFKHRQIIGAFFGVALFLFLPMLAGAAPTQSTGSGYPTQGTGNGFPTQSTGSGVITPSNTGGNSSQLENPLKFKTVCGLVTGLLKAVMIIGIPVAILFIVWAGFKFVLAQGNPGELTEARSNFLHVIIGIGIFVGASLIAAVIVNTLEQLGVTGISSCS